ncbi:MAG TPA: hypothetical protein VE177_04585 [Candidatus Binatus sp.]|nr:hypothetical protein [Candidatus Binatus sp.]
MIFLGIVFMALNPFFILWWLSVGVALITLAISDMIGVLVM